MNIFKILASGDGSINEPNVSAFLGYLLNPKADHGIGDELLKNVLFSLYKRNKESSLKDFLIDKYDDCRNLSANSNFEIEVLLEQAFTSNETDKKEIVDIVILCFEKKIMKTESLAKIVLSNSNKGELKQIFLIENKIRDSATREGQLINQCKSTIDTLTKLLDKKEKEIKEILSIIFISPNGDKSNNQFLQLEQDTSITIPKLHIHWNELLENKDTDDSNYTITSFLKSILLNEAKGENEAINEYTKSTIKSFITFIDNDFKSAIEEELEGETIRDIGYDFKEFKNKYNNEFTDNSWILIEAFQKAIKEKYDTINVRYSKTHPVSVLIKDDAAGKKIFSFTHYGKQLKIQLVHRNHLITQNNKDLLIDYLKTYDSVEVIPKDNKVIEIKSNSLTLEKALAIFDKQYELIPK